MNSTDSPITLAWRIMLDRYESDAAYERLEAFLLAHREVVDEIALFDSFSHHLYIPLETLARRAAVMARRIRSLKAAGVPSVGINAITTLGHRNEAWDTLEPLPFQPMVGHDGVAAFSSACPNSAGLRQYVRAKYTLLAEQQPDFIWVDDDLRYHHHTIVYPCFCETCLEIFAQESGKRFQREELVQAFNDPSQGELRQAWIDHNVRSLDSLLRDVEEAVHSVNPAIELGLMTVGPGWTTYAPQAYERWFGTLKAIKARPGGGFYSDHNRLEMLEKIFETGRQNVDLPATVSDRQYELENFPYQPLAKAVQTTLNECTLVLGIGLNGIAFNAFGWWDGSLSDYEPILSRAAELRPSWEKLVTHSQGLPTSGLWTAWTDQLMARRQVHPGEDWFAWDKRYHFMDTHILAQIGLPLCVDQPAQGTVLYGRVAEAFTDEELRHMLSGGVLMDSEALGVLEGRGLAHLAGARLARRLDNGVLERLTSDPLNGPYSGEIRDVRIEFWPNPTGMGDVLEGTSPDTRVLAELIDFYKRPLGPCVTAYENELGGRVAVMGFAPWVYLHGTPKRTQLLNLADWITGGRLAVRIDETVPLTPFVKMSADRKRAAILVLNNGLEKVERATLHVRMPMAPVSLLGVEGQVEIKPIAEEGGWRVILEDMEPWTIAILLVG